jgi:hypothetical protein
VGGGGGIERGRRGRRGGERERHTLADAERGTRGVIRALEGVVEVHDARCTCHAPLVTVPFSPQPRGRFLLEFAHSLSARTHPHGSVHFEKRG